MLKKVAEKVFLGWKWHHNISLSIKGHIWIGWKPSSYEVQVLEQLDQFIHRHVTQLSTKKKFYVTFVYGINHEQQRHQFWIDLQSISQQMTEAWCILKDFNSALHKEDRKGGNEIMGHKIEDLANLLDTDEMQEMSWSGAYFSWTNKTIWSRIDRVFINVYWYESFDYTHTCYLTNGLSDYTPRLIEYPYSPKPKIKFQFCDM